MMCQKANRNILHY